MKQWLTILGLTICLLICGCALAEEPVWEVDGTFEEFQLEVEVPYGGRWMSFDGAFSAFLPENLVPRAAVRDDITLADYDCEDEEGNQYELRVIKYGEDGSLDTLQKQEWRMLGKVHWVRSNGIPVLAGMSNTVVNMQFGIEGKGRYALVLNFPATQADSVEKLSTTICSMLFSICGDTRGTPVTSFTMEEEASEENGKFTLEMRFVFEDVGPENWARMNRKLAEISATAMRVESASDYLRGHYCEDRPGSAPVYSFGFESVTLVCEQDDSAKSFHFQLAQEVVEEAKALEGMEYLARWQLRHPQYDIERMYIREFDGQRVYLVVYKIDP